MRAALVFALVLACGPHASRPTPAAMPWASSGIDWSKPPAIAPTSLAVPPVRALSLDQIRVLVVENHRLPFVSVTAVMTTAGARADGAKPGLAALTAELVRRASHGQIETSIASDSMTARLVARTEDLDRAAPLLANVLRDPAFSADDLIDARRVRLAELAEHRARPRTVAAQVFDHLVFTGHPYEHPAEGIADGVAAVTSEDIRGFLANAYRPDALTLIVAGDVHDEQLHALTRPFADWQAPAAPAPASPALSAYARRLAIVDMPGADQAVVLVGRRDATSPADRLAADVANTVLGGGPGARLDRTLHDQLAVTFGAGSSFWHGQLAGSWTVASTFPTARTAEALRATLAEVEKARTTDATAEEVSRAKEELSRAIAGAFETNAGTARALERLVAQGLPADGYSTYLRQLATVTPATARAAIQSTWSDLSIVIVGDRAKLAADLTKLGLPIEQYTP
ncbi:MAG TPA: pitrilysin family protein [Kofleriaceae bacterium]|nr:pitrilysin family protein [Kofleriaceae bacterium]